MTQIPRFTRCFALLILALFSVTPTLRAAESPDFNKDVLPILTKYCNACHNATDKEGGLVLESYDALLNGGKRGAAIIANQAAASRLIRLLDGQTEPRMPPAGNDPPSTTQIATLTAWINAGAKGPTGATPDPTILLIPQIKPTATIRQAVTAINFNATGDQLAIGRYAQVEITDRQSHAILHKLGGLRGQVNEVLFTPDGKRVIAAAGEPGLVGEIAIWELPRPEPVKVWRGHRDSIYALAYAPELNLLASGSYDQSIILWDLTSGQEVRRLSGHNGAIMSLAFARAGKLLASASADRTVKLWNPATGERVETFAQPSLDQLAVTFSADGNRIAAAGADNRIRIWELSATAKEGSNPLLHARFAHEQPLLKLLWSPDGKTLASAGEDRRIKLWNPQSVSEKLLLEEQPDQIGALAWSPNSELLAVGRLDGQIALYQAETGKAVEPLPAAKPIPAVKPELGSLEPRGIQRGQTVKVLVRGKHLDTANKVLGAKPGLQIKLLDDQATSTQRFLEITTTDKLARGKYDLQLQTEQLVSDIKLAFWVDELPQLERTLKTSPTEPTLIQLPLMIWGNFSTPGITEQLVFNGQQGQQIVLDMGHRQLGEKRNMVVQVIDPNGQQLHGLSAVEGDTDPLFQVTLPVTGRYLIRIQELELQPATWRLTVGDFGFVTGAWPLVLPAEKSTQVELLGFNLPKSSVVTVNAPATGDVTVPFQAQWRSRGPIMLQTQAQAAEREQEPNNDPQSANQLKFSGPTAAIAGRLHRDNTPDVDFYRITMQQGQTVVIETLAARRGSPADTKISLHTPDGKPVPRLLLQAVRDSHINFRPMNSEQAGVRLKNWEEMELNDYIYYGGEVNRLFRHPQGPDSDSLMYVADNGKRLAYFDTTTTSHANYDAAYVVEPHPPGSKLPNIGLPIFELAYQNDDASDRDLKTDSRITFTAPASSDYLIRVEDSRNTHSERHVYQLSVREPQPDFSVTLNGMNPSIPAGTGREVSFKAQCRDGFQGEIQINLANKLPPGFTLETPIVIQAGQTRAAATIFATPDAKQSTADFTEPKFTATALLNGQLVQRPAGSLGIITLAAAPKLLVELLPRSAADQSANEITLEPGRSVTALLKLHRQGFKGAVSLDVLNLPHGVIVDNIGLNAVLIRANEDEREIVLTAANWVNELDRSIAAIARVEGGLTSQPVRFKIRKAKNAEK